MKSCSGGIRGNSVVLIKAAVNVIQFVGKSSVGSGSILGSRRVVGHGLQTLPDVLRVVGGEMFLKLVPVFGLTGLDGLSCCISRFLCLSLYASCLACSLCLI